MERRHPAGKTTAGSDLPRFRHFGPTSLQKTWYLALAKPDFLTQENAMTK
jgi:hypothetical protein